MSSSRDFQTPVEKIGGITEVMKDSLRSFMHPNVLDVMADNLCAVRSKHRERQFRLQRGLNLTSTTSTGESMNQSKAMSLSDQPITTAISQQEAVVVQFKSETR